MSTTKGLVLITGGSSGIGLELARCFAKNGYSLILVARNKKELTKAASSLEEYKVTVRLIVKDLSLQNAAFELAKEAGDIDILVNNAGFGRYGFFSEIPIEDELNMISLNISTLTTLTKLFLPKMISRKNGKILNVASTAAFQPGPLMAVYYATKAYVLHFSEAIANELKGSGVTVTALCPGPTKTGFQKNAKMGHSSLFDADAAAVALAGYRGLMKGKTIVIPGIKNRVLTFCVRLFTRNTITAIVRDVNSRW